MSRHSPEWSKLPLSVRLQEEARRLAVMRSDKNSERKNQELFWHIQGD